ncbi:MAG TPA: YpdA family putative bacillithiol disulfide reductase [Bacteroidota bacterium]|jgi:thioredoxin reductase (NADPH)
MSHPHTYDLLIIGAGPAGLACAIEARNAGMSYLVADKGGIVDSIQRYQREMYFFSTPELLEIGGVPFVVPSTRPTTLDCVNYYRSVADHYALHASFYDAVLSAVKEGERFMLRMSGGAEHHARAVVVATGYYGTPNPLDVPGERLPHVSHYYRDPLPYYRQRVLVVGGKNSAVEAALDLWRHGARVTLVHRGPALTAGVKYWILPDFENRVADGSIRTRFGTTVEEFRPGSTVVRGPNGTREEEETDFAFILIGYRPEIGFLKSLGIGIEADSLAPVHNPETMETNVPNLFVAGGMVGGRFNNRVFIENGRGHGKKIVDCLKGRV